MTSSKHNDLPNVPSPNTIILGVRASTYELGIGERRLAKHSVHNNSFNLIKDIYIYSQNCRNSLTKVMTKTRMPDTTTSIQHSNESPSK